MIYLDTQKRFLHMLLFLVFIVFLCFIRVAHAQLSIEECNNKRFDLLMSGFSNSGDLKIFNIVQYKQWLGYKALYQGECSHLPSASDDVKLADKYLQERVIKCQENGQGSNCGVGPVATNSQQNSIPVQAKQVPTSAENLNDVPKVFGSSSTPKPTKLK